jgi:glycerol-3-phosphate O-acyltransferase
MKSMTQWVSDLWLSAKALPDPLPPHAADNAHTVYVVARRYRADRRMVRQALAKSGVIDPAIIVLPLDGRRKKSFDRAMSELLCSEDPVDIIPVSVFWGRRPVKESSIWRTMFSDNWVVPGVIGRFITIVTQGRRVECFFSPALSLERLKASSASEEDLSRKLTRVLRTHFRRQREAVVGPDMSHRRTLQLQVLSSPNVIKAMAEVPGNAEKKAKGYLNEIASDYSYAVLRLFDRVLNWLWKKLYNGVNIHGMGAVHELAQDHELIYVPCHRSHIDYLLLSWVIYHQGLMPPHIAAGINLNMPVLGSLLRRGGAFFIRREFRDQPLYRAVLESYVATMCHKGFPIEYFIEGGRSRTGRLLQPKAGMLMMTLGSIRSAEHRPLAFVPVYIGYERILESHSYIKEMYGKSKKKESLAGLLSARKLLKENYGQVHVNFGAPIMERDLRANAMDDAGLSMQDKDSDAFRDSAAWLSRAIMMRINSHAVVTPVNLVATILLGTPKHALLEKQLAVYLRAFSRLCELPGLETLERPEAQDWAQLVQRLEPLRLFERNPHEMGDILFLNERGALAATYLRNNTLHCFIMAGVVATVLINKRRVSDKRLQDLCRQLYPYLKNELFLPWEDAELEDVVRQVLQQMQELDLVKQQRGIYEVPDGHSESHHLLSIIAATSKGTLERFYITLQLIITHPPGHYTAETLVADCVLMAQRLSLLHSFHAPDFFDKSLFRTFIKGLVDKAYLQKYDGERLAFDRRVVLGEKRFIYMLSPEVRLAILRITQH